MRQANGGESGHDYMRDVRLWNWGCCGRQNSDRPDNERGSSSIYMLGRADGKPTIIFYRCQMCKRDQPDEGTCCGLQMLKIEERIPQEPEPEPLDHQDAEELDGWVKQLAVLHRNIIILRFYLRRRVLKEDVDGSVRALLDKISDNRKVVNLMKRLGWT